ncbi:hypothetical protein AB6A40_008286 [Gnathostoma spinigerum]|uniref:Rab-GAP TBC domain-containing protein n=1 Tax=Gnathostoma spinigerum TaxID=75299 RepID=A0ABD6EY94_9BILA
MDTFSGLLKKAQGAINNLRGAKGSFIGKDGDIVYSKNNVCIHDTCSTETSVHGCCFRHIPGYLTIHCQNDETIGITLILQWLPNTTIEKNPASIRSVSPWGNCNSAGYARDRSPDLQTSIKSDDELEYCGAKASSCSLPTTEGEENDDDCSVITEPEISVEMNGDMITVTSLADRPMSLLPPKAMESDGSLSVPMINVIPNTPVDTNKSSQSETSNVSDASPTTSEADEFSEKDVEDDESSPCDDSGNDSVDTNSGTACLQDTKRISLENYRKSCANLYKATPEQFARTHNLMWDNDKVTSDCSVVAVPGGKVIFHQKPPTTSLFSVNLGKMRSLRLFFSNSSRSSGQLVIASPDSLYKILHFHYGGLDRLGELFEQWDVTTARFAKYEEPSTPFPSRHLLIVHPEVNKTELDPEDGLYHTVNWDFWKLYKNKDGGIDDSLTIRKAIYFASLDPPLRREAWPFLLRVYSWSSTLEQREGVRNDLFLEYQKIRKKRMLKKMKGTKEFWDNIEHTINKDVVRTDRRNPFYSGKDNPNVEKLRNILINYATVFPEVNYVQGMSDLLAPLLSVIQDEADTYWCFVGLMQQTPFASTRSYETDVMEMNMEYLRELIKLLLPRFFQYLVQLGDNALELAFVHRWILLCFKVSIVKLILQMFSVEFFASF